ncbi:hypothetical protein C5U48_02710 [Mycolicibacter virginiensis]|uniref:Uncharacterized protein n=1 Tax=Mycolicibacter virginiensis TaxID=1795032 RepID=A0A9X7P051_9MYCO|nr:hypothetical protein [Mycolicibacter virginiensis]PQM53737.1 hypothetical protein C5U48_02710 [Mycolicibacter virginiensis]
MTEQHVKITDPAAFPGKIQKIKAAAAALRDLREDVELILTSTDPEKPGVIYATSRATTTGKPAPIYDPALEALTLWVEKMQATIAAACDSADNCADTAYDQFMAIMDVDEVASAEIKQL